MIKPHMKAALRKRKALQKAQGLFDDFRVWSETEGDDPFLIGRIINGDTKTPYLIAEW